jgi:hypothetical protein
MSFMCYVIIFCRHALILLGFIVSAVVCQSRPSFSYDDSLFCAPDGETVVVFVDVTTPFDDRSKTLFEDGILEILSSLSGGQHFDIFTIEDAFSTSQTLFRGCVPYCASKGWGDWLTSDCTSGLIRLKTNEQKRLIGSALRSRLSRSEELPTSEIVRTLTFDLNSVLKRGIRSRVYIFSDMIENSEFMPGKLFHSSKISDLIAKTVDNQLIPELNGSQVNVFGVGRGGNLGRKPLPQPMLLHIKEFWTAFFKKAGVADGNIHIGESLSVN